MTADPELEARLRARIGTVLKEKWHIDSLLGIGGMAAVYAATHRNQKRVAVKVLHPEYAILPEVRNRFLREGYVANSVGHRGALTIDDDDVAEDGSAFLVMELLEGETLQARWERKGRRFGLKQTLIYIDEVLDVLVAAHPKGIVHRDLKPENLFLTTAKMLKVLDFGIARIRQESSKTGGTVVGAVMGTPEFMAPEQARGRWDFVDGQTDLWAVGATMFTLLSGRYVHEGETPNEQLALACTQSARSIGTVAKLPQRVIDIVDRALAYDKRERWLDAAAMQRELCEVFDEVRNEVDLVAVSGASRASFPELSDVAGPEPCRVAGAAGPIVLIPAPTSPAPVEGVAPGSTVPLRKEPARTIVGIGPTATGDPAARPTAMTTTSPTAAGVSRATEPTKRAPATARPSAAILAVGTGAVALLAVLAALFFKSSEPPPSPGASVEPSVHAVEPPAPTTPAAPTAVAPLAKGSAVGPAAGHADPIAGSAPTPNSRPEPAPDRGGKPSTSTLGPSPTAKPPKSPPAAPPGPPAPRRNLGF